MCTTNENVRISGIEIVGEAPWGTHFCLFYETKKDLIEILVHYFKAGLEANECCMWITSEPLNRDEAIKAMTKALPNFDLYLENRQIEIIPYNEWYLKDGVFDMQQVLDDFIEKLDEALARGYDGMRVTGNTAWLRSKYWRDFTDYEEMINTIIGKYQMMAICTYYLEKCGVTDIIDVISNHQYALIRREGKWEIIQSSEHKKIMMSLKESERNMHQLLHSIPSFIVEMDLNGIVLFLNKVQPGFSLEDFLGKNVFDFTPQDGIESLKSAFSKVLVKAAPVSYESVDYGPNRVLTWYDHQLNPVIVDGEITSIIMIVTEITERKQAEQHIQNFFDLSPYFLCIGDLTTYRCLKINPAFEKNLGYSKEELLSKTIFEFIHPLDLEKTTLRIEKTLGSKEPHLNDIEFRFLRKNGSYIWTSWRSNILVDEGIAYFMGSDITDQKSREKELKKRLMKFKIEDGLIYLVKERTSKISFDAFRDILGVGHGGLALVRTPTVEFRRIIKGVYEALWLSEHESEDAIDPMISFLKDRISKLVHHDVLLIDRLDYIISKNGFGKTAEFIQWLRERCYIWNLIAILSIDPKTLDRKEMRILEKECEELEPLHTTTLSPELFDMLTMIYGRSLKNVSSTYETMMKDLRITRPTVRKRIGTLESMGYVIEEKRGYKKTFILTEKGEQIFTGT